MITRSATDADRYHAATNLLVWLCAMTLALTGCDGSDGQPLDRPSSRHTAAAALPSSSPAGGRSEATFRSLTTYASAGGVGSDLATDGRAFTVRFSDMVAKVESGESPSPAATRVFSFIVPVDGGGNGVKISFAASGYAFTTGGASGYAVLSVNGQTSTMHFSPGTDQEFVQQLEFDAGPTPECYVSVLILVERGSADTAYLNIASFDAEILPRRT